MKKFLTLTSLLEGFTGMALIIIPGYVIQFLLGMAPVEAGGRITAMLAGAAILSLAVICGLLRDASDARRLVKGMILFNGIVTAISLYALFGMGFPGLGLWLIILAHSGLGAWGIVTLRAR